MNLQYFAGAACRALTARKDGPSLYDVCDPILLRHHGGDAHLAKFYKTALGNPGCVRCCGGPACRNCVTRVVSAPCRMR